MSYRVKLGFEIAGSLAIDERMGLQESDDMRSRHRPDSFKKTIDRFAGLKVVSFWARLGRRGTLLNPHAFKHLPEETKSVNSTDNTHCMFLFKFSQRQYLEEFRRNGLLYMNTLAHFSSLERDPVRGDRFEGSDQIHQPKDIRHICLTNSESDKVFTFRSESIVGPVLIGFGRHRNVYCMFALINKIIKGEFVDSRAFGLGDSFIVVLRTQEFIDRVCAAAERSHFRYSFGSVQYYDENSYSGDTGPFRKPGSFAYQQEFRFLIEPGSGQPIKLCVGNLEDITSPILPLAEINRIVEFEFSDEV